MRRLTTLLLAVALLLAANAAPAQTRNGFDLGGALGPADEIFSGGPRRDGIPAIDRSRFSRAGETRFVRGDDRVLGVGRNGVAKAYPVRILNWHEVVNGRSGAEPIVVTFCPVRHRHGLRLGYGRQAVELRRVGASRWPVQGVPLRRARRQGARR